MPLTRVHIGAFVAFILLATPVGAADVNGDGEETILLPLAFRRVFNEIPGAHGSIWSGQVWMENRSDEIVQLFNYCGNVCLGWGQGAAGEVHEPLGGRTPETGFMFFLPVAQASDVTFSNRIFERTMRSQPRGVDIPVVREGAFFSATQTFLGVPAGEGVRVSLRLYDPWYHFRESRPGPALERVTVEIRDQRERPIGTTTLAPLRPVASVSGEFFHKPGFNAIYDLGAVAPAIMASEFVFIRVTPVPAGAQYYAMVAVTDNETQTVSIVTAQ